MSTPGNREVAHRVLAAEFDDADLEYSESDEERAPNYVVTPSGARVNRLFFVGVLTEKERVNDDVLRARIVDPTGAFVVYAGQYQPDELAFLEGADPPAFVAVTGKARTFQPDDSDRTFTSVRPETITEVDAADRDRAAVTTAEHTVDRVAAMATALGREERGDDLASALVADGTPPELAEGITLALDHYGTDLAYLDALRTLSLDVARVVAGDLDEAGDLPLAPDAEATDPVDRAALTAGAETLTGGESEGAAAATSEAAASAADETAASEGAGETTATSDAETTGEPAATVGADAADATADAAEPTTTTGSEVDAATTTAETTEADPGATDDAGAAEGPADDAASADTAMGSEGVDDGEDDLGDFDGSLSTDADAAAEADDEAAASPDTGAAETDAAGDAEAAAPAEPTADTDEMYEFDEEERQEIEEEYGTEFSTGSEVESPDEDLAPDAPAAGEAAAADETAPDEAAAADEAAAVDETAPDEAAADAAAADEAAADESDETADDADVADVLLDAMQELDDGEGAERPALIDTVADRTGADESAVEDAIQDALMGGQCYEPDEGRLKPI
jgi:RPA family protein